MIDSLLPESEILGNLQASIMGQNLNQALNRLSTKVSDQRGQAKRQKPPINRRDKI